MKGCVWACGSWRREACNTGQALVVSPQETTKRPA